MVWSSEGMVLEGRASGVVWKGGVAGSRGREKSIRVGLES